MENEDSLPSVSLGQFCLAKPVVYVHRIHIPEDVFDPTSMVEKIKVQVSFLEARESGSGGPWAVATGSAILPVGASPTEIALATKKVLMDLFEHEVGEWLKVNGVAPLDPHK